MAGVAFFTRILNIKRALLVRLRDERTLARYRVGADFPLLATLRLGGAVGNEWNGRVRELSAFGLSLRLPPGATAVRNEATTVRFELEGRQLAVPCTVAHIRTQPAYTLCGLRLEFADFAQQGAWQQIVEAVTLGASFALVEGSRAPRPALGLARRQWRSCNKSRLTEWRETGTRQLDRFELVLEEYRFAGRTGGGGLEIQSIASGRAASSGVEVELHQLFLWVLANFPASVPADLKAFMLRTATTLASQSRRQTHGTF